MNSFILAAGITVMMSNSLTNTPNINYTSDSVIQEGISLESYETEVGDIEYNVIVDLPLGYKVYDDPETTYIDGLKINNRWVDSYEGLYFRTDEASITVKIVYADDVTGSLAQIHDGTFDWWSLLETPIGIITSLFSGISITSMITLAVNMFRSKKLKVKEVNEIAEESKKVAKESAEAQNAETKKMLNEFLETILVPLVAEIRTEMRDVIKAVAISNSRQKDAPLAILEMLENDTSDEKVKAVIAEAREKFKASLEQEEATKKSIAKKIETITSKAAKLTESVKDTTTDSAEGRY